MKYIRFRVVTALFGICLLTAPATAAPEDMLTAIYDLDVDAVEDLVRDGEPVDKAYYRNVLEVAGVMSESEPREVWWRRRLMDITGTLVNQSEPDEATFEALKKALFPDARGQAAMDLQRALSLFISTEGRHSRDEFQRQLDLGADPLLRTARGNHPDMFGYLIYMAQKKREYNEHFNEDIADLEEAVEHAWRELRSYAGAPDKTLAYARAHLDAAMTPPGKPIEYSRDINGDLPSISVRMRIAGAQLDTFEELLGDATDIGAKDEDTGTTRIDWAREYAEALAE